MERYLLKNRITGEAVGRFSGIKEAGIWLAGHLQDCNKGLSSLDEFYVYPLDFVLEELPPQLPPCPGSYDAALEYLHRTGEEDAHGDAATALRQLFTLCEAWNGVDGFVPDFTDKEQRKYYPWFVFDPEQGRFVYVDSYWTATEGYMGYGYRLCLSSEERAEEFGRQFIDLWNQVLMPNKFITN